MEMVGLFIDDIIEKEKDSKERKPKTKEVDFNSLVERVKLMPVEDNGQVALWTEVYKLPKWHFIVNPNVDISNAEPFVGEVNNKGWLFIFTDGKHANEFAEVQRFLNDDGKATTIAMEPLKAAIWISMLGEDGIYGVRFNEGKHGWFAPIENLLPMYRYLKDRRKI